MSEQAQAHAVTQAEAFEALMIDIWEGGPAYDLTFRDGKRANNALDMLGALFPDVAVTRASLIEAFSKEITVSQPTAS